MKLITENLRGCYALQRITTYPEANKDRFAAVYEVKCSKILGIIERDGQLLPMVVDDQYYGISTIDHKRFVVKHIPDASELFYWVSYARDQNTGELYEVDSEGYFFDEDAKPVDIPNFLK